MEQFAVFLNWHSIDLSIEMGKYQMLGENQVAECIQAIFCGKNKTNNTSLLFLPAIVHHFWTYTLETKKSVTYLERTMWELLGIWE